jgi:hypothetical protein
MMFGMFTTPFFFIFPLIIFFLVARVAAHFIRGISRPPHRDLSDAFGVPPELYRKDPRELTRSAKSDESKIFKLALRLKGRLTVSDVVIETGVNLHQAEELLENLVDSVHVRMEVDDRGIVTYEFPEIIRRLEDGAPGANQA